MLARTNWIERRFNFDFRVGLFLCILERLRGTPARLDKPMRVVDMAFFAAEHDDQHLSIITELTERLAPGTVGL